MDTGDGVLGTNMYAYCLNDPVNGCDPSGFAVETIADVAGLVWSVSDMIANPSLLNAIFLAWDIASIALPVVPGSYVAKGAKLFTKADDVVDFAKLMDKTIDAAKITNKIYKSYTKGHFRQNLETLTGIDDKLFGDGIQAHHVFPNKFEKEFAAAGISNIHTPIYGAWVPTKSHLKFSSEYNKMWKSFFELYPNAGKNEVLGYGKMLASIYGFVTYY
jgi:hypothetical protein